MCYVTKKSRNRHLKKHEKVLILEVKKALSLGLGGGEYGLTWFSPHPESTTVLYSAAAPQVNENRFLKIVTQVLRAKFNKF